MLKSKNTRTEYASNTCVFAVYILFTSARTVGNADGAVVGRGRVARRMGFAAVVRGSESVADLVRRGEDNLRECHPATTALCGGKTGVEYAVTEYVRLADAAHRV